MNLDRLEALAHEATLGEWRTGRSVGRTLYANDALLGLLDERSDAAYIAAADPSTVLRLIAVARAAAAIADEAPTADHDDDNEPELCVWCALDRALAALEGA